MSQAALSPISPRQRSLKEFWSKEDWWAVWLGLGIVLVGWLLFAQGLDLRWLAVLPPKWSTASQLGAHFATSWPRYLAQFGFWLALFGVGTVVMGRSFREFAWPFALLYLGAVLVVSIGAWDQAQRYGTEAPLVALLLGLVLANVVPLPRTLDAGFRVAIFVLSAALTAPAGTFYAFNVMFVDPPSFLSFSVMLLIMLPALVGGAGSILGPLWGSIIVVATTQLMGALTQAPGISSLVYGLVLIAASFGISGWAGLLPRRRAMVR